MDLAFSLNSTSGAAPVERVRFTGAGSVGIGTSTPAAKLFVTGSTNVVGVQGSGSAAPLMYVDGSNGRLFEVTDDLSDSLFSVNTIAGLPVIEAFADNTVTLGAYNAICGPTVTINANPTDGCNITVNGYVYTCNGTGYVGTFSTYGVSGVISGGPSWNLSYCNVTVSNSGTCFYASPNFMVVAPSSGECLQYSGFSGNLCIGGVICQNAYSDCKYKKNITPITSALDKLDAITGVEFDWNELGQEEAFKEGHEVGVIAQDVQSVFPQAVREVSKEREDHVVTALVVDYEKLIPLLIQSVKELKLEIDNIKTRLDGSNI
jgi:hypothetical protein